MKYAEKLLLIPEEKYKRLLAKVKDSETSVELKREKEKSGETDPILVSDNIHNTNSDGCFDMDVTSKEVISKISDISKEGDLNTLNKTDAGELCDDVNRESDTVEVDKEKVEHSNDTCIDSNSAENTNTHTEPASNTLTDNDSSFDYFQDDDLYTKIKPKKKRKQKTEVLGKAMLMKKWLKF